MRPDVYTSNVLFDVEGAFFTLAITACLFGFLRYGLRLLLDWRNGADPYHLRHLMRVSFTCFMVGIVATIAWQLSAWTVWAT